MIKLDDNLSELLKEAGLGKEKYIIGEKFSFAYEIVDEDGKVWNTHRVSGIILGFHIEVGGVSDKKGDSFTLITTPLPTVKMETRDGKNIEINLKISFHSSNYEYSEGKSSWSIMYPPREEVRGDGFDNHWKVVEGIFEIL